jgi:hypothetical protein
MAKLRAPTQVWTLKQVHSMRRRGGKCKVCGEEGGASVVWQPCGCRLCEACTWGALRRAEGDVGCPFGCAGADGEAQDTRRAYTCGGRPDEEAHRRKAASLAKYLELPDTMCVLRKGEKVAGVTKKAAFKAKSKEEVRSRGIVEALTRRSRSLF